MVKPARVAGERVGTRESIGRRQSKVPGGNPIGHFAFWLRLLEQRTERLGTARWTVKPDRAAGERRGANEYAVRGRRRIDGQAREGSERSVWEHASQ